METTLTPAVWFSTLLVGSENVFMDDRCTLGRDQPSWRQVDFNSWLAVKRLDDGFGDGRHLLENQQQEGALLALETYNLLRRQW